MTRNDISFVNADTTRRRKDGSMNYENPANVVKSKVKKIVVMVSKMHISMVVELIIVEVSKSSIVGLILVQLYICAIRNHFRMCTEVEETKEVII